MPQPSPIFGSAPTAPRWSRLFEDREALLDDVVRLAVLHVGDEADAAGILLVGGIVEALGRRAGRDRAPNGTVIGASWPSRGSRPTSLIQRSLDRSQSAHCQFLTSAQTRLQAAFAAAFGSAGDRIVRRPAVLQVFGGSGACRVEPAPRGLTGLSSAESRPFRPRFAGGVRGISFRSRRSEASSKIPRAKKRRRSNGTASLS